MHSQCMAKTVGATHRGHAYASTCNPKIERIANYGRLDRAPRRTDAKEQPSGGGFPASVAQVREQRRGNLISQRQDQGRADLWPWHTNHLCSPLNMVNVQACD